MASLTVSRPDIFPAGTTVSAYPVAGRGETPASGAPPGSVIASGIVAASGLLVISGLADATGYILYAGSPDRYLRYRTGPATGGGQLPTGDSFRYDATRLGTLKAAIANRANAPIRVLGLGDSIMEGDQNTIATRWFNVVAGLLRTAYPSSGVGGGLGYIPARFIGTNTLTNPWVYVGTKAVFASASLGVARGYTLSAGATASLAFTGTSVDLHYLKGSTGGTFNWQIDGGGATLIDSNQAATQEVKLNIPAGASGAHTLLITNVTSNTFLCGATVFDGDEAKGWNFYEAGHSGAVSGDLIDASSSGYDGFRLVAPHLVVIDFGTNDWATGGGPTLRVSPRAMAENLHDLIAAARSAETDPSVILVEPARRGTITAPSGQKGSYGDFNQAIRRVALTDGRVTIFDRAAVMGDQSSGANSLVGADKVHPNTAGHAAVAAALSALIQAA